VGLLDRLRPRIALSTAPAAPSVVTEQLVLEVAIDAPRAERVDRVEVWLTQTVRVPGGSSETSRVYLVLAKGHRLRRGTQRLRRSVRMPQEILADHDGERIGVETIAEVRLVRPWRVDARRRFRLRIAAPPAAPEVTPRAFTTLRDGDAPRLEAAIDRDQLVPGGTVAGRVGMLGGDADSVSVTLRARESWDGRTTDGHSWAITLPGPVVAGASAAFAFGVPAAAVPGYTTARSGLRWELVVHAERRLARDLTLTIPVTLVRGEPDPSVGAAPLVGGERVARLWDGVARDHGAGFDGVGISATVGTCRVRVEPDEGGAGVRAVVEHPDLGLDLRVGSRRGLRRIWASRPQESWGGAGRSLECREPHQGRAYAEQVLAPAGALLVQAGDLRAELFASGAGDDARLVARSLAAAIGLAERYEAAAPTVPMPSAFAGTRAAFLRAADDHDARFAPGRPRLAARDGSWSAEVRGERLVVTVRAPSPIDAAHHLDTARPSEPELPRDARGPFARLRARGGRLRVSGGEGTLEGPVVSDPEEWLAVVTDLRALLRVLRTETGPYR